MATTLPLFWKLSSSSREERLDASVKLVGALEDFQSTFQPSNPQAVSDEEAGDEVNLDAMNSQDVSYAIRRLIRGLASPRESSRLGFAVALTELFSRISTVTSSQIISLILEASQTQGWMNGQDERDVYFGRLFGLTSLIECGLLLKTDSSSSSEPLSTLHDFQTVVSELISLGEKKSWLKESCWWSIMLAIRALNAAVDCPWREDALEWTKTRVFQETPDWFPEKIAVWFELPVVKYLQPTFKDKHILTTANLVTLARILKDGEVEDEVVDSKKGNCGTWTAQPHFVWDVILGQLLPQSPTAAPAIKISVSFQDFFRIVVDESLFSANSSPERKYWGFQIVERVLPRLDSSYIPYIFTQNFMRTWINHLSKEDRYLHKAARKLATAVHEAVVKNPSSGFPLVLQLLGPNGNRNFDQLTKTKIVETILASMDGEGIANYVGYLTGQMYDMDILDTKDHITVDSKRDLVLDQFLALIRSNTISKEDRWIVAILEVITVHSFFIVKHKSENSPFVCLRKAPKPGISDAMHVSCHSRLLAALGDLTTQTSIVKDANGKSVKLPARATDGEYWISKVLAIVTSVQEAKDVIPLFDTGSDMVTLRKKTNKIIKRLGKVEEGRRESADGAQFLLQSILLRSYGNVEEIEEVSESLQDSIDRVIQLFDLKEPLCSETQDTMTEAEDPKPVDLIVDTLIGYLEQSTAYLRATANYVFSQITSEVEDTTLDLILKQLEVRDVGEDSEDEEMADEAEDPEDLDQGGVDEVISTSEDSDDDDDDADVEVDEELRQRIADALKANGMAVVESEGDSDHVEGDGSDDESDEELMDDDQMLQLDEKLAEIFRSRAGDGKAKKDVGAQREATHFKLRVLDFVDVFLKRQPTSVYNLKVVLPLIRVLLGASTDERQLSEKTVGLLRSRIAKSKDVPVLDDRHQPQAEADLKDLHQIARKSASSELTSIISPCSLYLARSLALHPGEQTVTPIYQASLEDFVCRKGSHIHPNFIHDFIRRVPHAAWGLRSRLTELCSPGQAVNVYRQCQAFQLLGALIGIIPQLPNQATEALAFLPAIRDAVYKTISNACSPDVSKVTPAQLKDIIKIARQGVQQSKHLGAAVEHMSEIWASQELVEVQAALASSERFKNATSLQAMCQQILDSLKPSVPSKAKKSAKQQPGSAASQLPSDPLKSSKRKVPDADHLEQKKGRRKKVKKNQDD